MTATMTDELVARRRAVEALRSGVPSWDAVALLGSGQPEAEDRFAELLDQIRQPRRPEGRPSCGLLLGGGFGTGKSHLLTHLGHLASSSDFVVSTVVISKETPLHDPVKTFRAAIGSAVDPGRIGGVLADATASLDPDTARYAEFSRWVNSPASELDERFRATLLLHERLRGGEVPGSDETVEALVRFWAGEPLRVGDLRRALKSVGAAGLFSFGPVHAAELARQRFRLVARLLRAAGRTGWVILFDEVELIGRYSVLQRGRSYAELARWLGGWVAGPELPLVSVLAMTDDFEAAVLSGGANAGAGKGVRKATAGKDDRNLLPAKLRAKQSAEWDETAALAEAGMRRIEHDMLILEPPDDTELDRTYATLKQLHADAFSWSPPDVAGLERLGATRMRQYVRAWINEWDLLRLDPAFRPETEAAEIASDYREDAALESQTADDEPGGSDQV
jgi:hypothetical protein